MSSVGSSFAQIPTASKFFLVTSAGTPAWSETAVSTGLASKTNLFSRVGGLITTTNMATMSNIYTGITNDYTLPASALLKDVGKELTFTVNGTVVERWRKVQFVNDGIDNESRTTGGVGGNAPAFNTFYVATFCTQNPDHAFLDPVNVCRVG